VHLIGFYYKNKSYLMFLKESYFRQYRDKERMTIFNGKEDLYLFNIYSCIVIIIIFSQKIIF